MEAVEAETEALNQGGDRGPRQGQGEHTAGRVGALVVCGRGLRLMALRLGTCTPGRRTLPMPTEILYCEVGSYAIHGTDM